MTKQTNRDKGIAFQRYIKKWLEERGWTVHNQTGTLSIIKKKGKIIPVPRSNDLFGCIDLEAKQKGKQTLYIQATLGPNIQRKADKILKHDFWNPTDTVQIWVKRGGGTIDIFELIDREFKHSGKIIRRKFYKIQSDEFNQEE